MYIYVRCCTESFVFVRLYLSILYYFRVLILPFEYAVEIFMICAGVTRFTIIIDITFLNLLGMLMKSKYITKIMLFEIN